MTDTTVPRVSVVVPVFNEAEVVGELARRCVSAATIEGFDPPDVCIVDDASTDDTAQRLLDAQLLHVHLLKRKVNGGQLVATRAGLRQATGTYVVVIDGDLQDPPELIAALVAELHAHPDLDVVFAAKQSRDDPTWFRVGRAVYVAIQWALARTRVPHGVGAYCVMRLELAHRVGGVRAERANLAPLLAALGARAGTIPYDKAGRYDGQSRVGLWGLIREAVGSMVLTGTFSNATRVMAMFALLVWVGHPDPDFTPAWLLASLLAAMASDRLTQSQLRPEDP